MTAISIVALDPGADTGAAQLFIRGDGSDPIFESHETDRLSVNDWLLARLRALHDTGQRTLVAVERFDVNQTTVRKGHDAQGPIRMIGAAELVAGAFGHVFRVYGRSDCKNLGTDELLKHLGWYVPGRDHANDAARVLALALQGWHPPTFQRLVVESGYLSERSDPGTPRA